MMQSPVAAPHKRTWSKPTLIDLDDARRVHSFVGPLTDALGIANGTDPTTS